MHRSATLDGVRGLAVAAVVGFHTLGTFAPATLHPLLWPVAGGILGVDLFFVLSGYLLARSWQANPSLADFWRRRARRLLPAYWVSLAILIPLSAPHLLRSPGRLALFATMQSSLVRALPWDVNASYWSLTPEVQFYLLLPALFVLLTKLGLRRTIVIVFAVSIVWRLFTTSHYHHPADLVPGRIDQFAVGMAAAVAGERLQALATRRVALAAVGGLGVVVPVYGYLFWTSGGDPHHLVEACVHPAVGALLGLLFLRLARVHRVRVLEPRPLRALGIVSYSLYLWHLPVLMLARSAGGRAAAHVFAGVAGSLLAAALSYVVVERPVLRTPRRARAKQPAVIAPVPELAGVA